MAEGNEGNNEDEEKAHDAAHGPEVDLCFSGLRIRELASLLCDELGSRRAYVYNSLQIHPEVGGEEGQWQEYNGDTGED
jgi:hypothetical protein